MSKILIFGHKNPDTDTITSAISLAYLNSQLDKENEYVACRLGEINDETKYALEYFNTSNIQLINNIANENVILVDHNERTQTADGFEEAKVLGLVDHHKISNFNVSEPLYVRVDPVGCTQTIIYDLYKQSNIEIPKHIAGLMLSAIISDTLLFKSPTCTELDVYAAKELANIADVNIDEYGLTMLQKGADLSKKTINEILNMDLKEFDINGESFLIGQVNTFNIEEVLKDKEKFIEEMKKENKGTFLFVITDVLNSTSKGIVVGNIEKVEKAYNQKVIDNIIDLPGIVSRKKQIVPPLM